MKSAAQRAKALNSPVHYLFTDDCEPDRARAQEAFVDSVVIGTGESFADATAAAQAPMASMRYFKYQREDEPLESSVMLSTTFAAAQQAVVCMRTDIAREKKTRPRAPIVLGLDAEWALDDPGLGCSSWVDLLQIATRDSKGWFLFGLFLFLCRGLLVPTVQDGTSDPSSTPEITSGRLHSLCWCKPAE